MKMMPKNQLDALKVGDSVTRLMAGSVPMDLKVTAIDDVIHCGDWMFHKETGAEIDEELGWDGVTSTGSYLTENPEPAPELELEPVGTMPVVGDQVVCFGDSSWRKIGKPYTVVEIIDEVKDNVRYHDARTGPHEYWEMARFKTGGVLMQTGWLAAFDMPRIYRVVKRKEEGHDNDS